MTLAAAFRRLWAGWRVFTCRLWRSPRQGLQRRARRGPEPGLPVPAPGVPALAFPDPVLPDRAGRVLPVLALAVLARSGLALAVPTGPEQAVPPPVARLAVVIDDVGDNPHYGRRAADLPAPINLAVLPHTPFAAELAERGHRNGHPILLHAPMAADSQPQLLGPGALLGDMDEATLRAQFRTNLASVPHAGGFNNHMGSALTRDWWRMRWLMREARERQLFFLDSRTTGQSVAPSAAQREGVPVAVRDVFLDHDPRPDAVRRQWQLALQKARDQGFATVIGHPKPATLALLEQELPVLAAQGIELVPVSALTLSAAQARADFVPRSPLRTMR